MRTYVFAAITAGVLVLVFSCSSGRRIDIPENTEVTAEKPFLLEPGALEGTYLKELWSAPYEHNKDLKNIYYDKGYFLLETVANELVKIDLLDGYPYKHRLELTNPLQFPPVVYEYPLANGDTKSTEIYVIQEGDLLCCVDAETLQEYHQEQLGYGVSCAPCPSEKEVILCAVGGRINNLSKQDVPKKQRSKSWTYSARKTVSASPRIKGNNVFFSSEDGYVYSMNASSGFVPGESWETKTYARIVTSPVLYKQHVYVASLDQNLYAFSEYRGGQIWKFSIGQMVLSQPYAYNNTIFVIGQDSPDGAKTMYAVNATNGESRWKKQVQGAGDTKYYEHGVKGVERFLAPGKELIYVLAQDKPEIWGLQIADGTLVHRIPLARRPEYVISHDAECGRRLEAIGLILMATKDGMVFALKEKSVY